MVTASDRVGDNWEWQRASSDGPAWQVAILEAKLARMPDDFFNPWVKVGISDLIV